MKKVKGLAAIFLFLALSHSLLSARKDTQTDVIATSPDQAKVLLENEHVRVLEYNLKPGQRDQWHTHPAKVSYVAKGGTLKIHLADGTSFDTQETEGTAVWMEALPRHYAENIGETSVQIILIEIKNAQ